MALTAVRFSAFFSSSLSPSFWLCRLCLERLIDNGVPLHQEAARMVFFTSTLGTNRRDILGTGRQTSRARRSPSDCHRYAQPHCELHRQHRTSSKSYGSVNCARILVMVSL